MPEALEFAGLVVLGAIVGAYGTLVGLGGGFVLVPVLLLLYPSYPTELITSISLAVVFANAVSGTLAYVRQRRIDYLAGNVFALATQPGAVIGALIVGYVAREVFDLVFACLLVAAAVSLVFSQDRVVARSSRRGEVSRLLTDAGGDAYAYSFSLPSGIVISFGAGFLSSLLGIGGGIIHVPAMIRVLRIPAHIATATSHYVLSFTALTGLTVHVITGQLDGGYERAALLALGVISGAQVGAHLSRRLEAGHITRLLSLAMLVLAVRLLLAVVLD